MDNNSLSARTEGAMAYMDEQRDEFWDGVMTHKFDVHIPTGFPELDKAMGGGLHGLNVLIASPGAGKSTLAVQIMSQIARSGHKVLFFSMEMKACDITAKIYSRCSLETGHPMDANEILALGKREDAASLVEALKAANHPCGEHCVIIPGHKIDTPEAIARFVEEFCEATGCKPVLIVDYLQHLAAKFPAGSDKQAVDTMLTNICNVGTKYGLPIILISSINRTSYDKPLTIAACKDSGSIEYAADTIMALDYTNRDGHERCVKQPNRPREVTVTLPKNRFGCLGATVDFKFDARYNNFTELPKNGADAAKKVVDTY